MLNNLQAMSALITLIITCIKTVGDCHFKDDEIKEPMALLVHTTSPRVYFVHISVQDRVEPWRLFF